MPHTVSRILLAVLLVPLASLAYLSGWDVAERVIDGDGLRFIAGGVVAWAFVAVYWTLLWRRTVRWTAGRLWFTAGAVLASVLAGVVVFFLFNSLRYANDFPYFMVSATVPVLWLVGTIYIWRETPQEFVQRRGNKREQAIVCPVCQYNMTGLTAARCPECGTQFTLDELLIAQRETDVD